MKLGVQPFGRLAAAGALALLAGCITGSYEVRHRLHPITMRDLEALRPGEDDIQACVDQLGAPLYVWEYRVQGAALAFGWFDSHEWNLSVNVPVADQSSTAFSFTSNGADFKGAVLFFDDDDTLDHWRAGYLAALVQELRQPPNSIEMIEDYEERKRAADDS